MDLSMVNRWFSLIILESWVSLMNYGYNPPEIFKNTQVMGSTMASHGINYGPQLMQEFCERHQLYVRCCTKDLGGTRSCKGRVGCCGDHVDVSLICL